jgi:fucose permease
MIALAIFVIAFIVILFTKIEEPEQDKVDLSMVKKALGYRHFALGALAIFLYMGIEVGVPNYVQQYLSTETATQLNEQKAVLEAYERGDSTMQDAVTAARAYVNVTTNWKEINEEKDSVKKAELIAGVEKSVVEKSKDIQDKAITSATIAKKHAGLGIPSGTVGMIIAVYWFMMLIGRLVGASIGGKVSARAMITTVSIATLALVIFGMFAPAIDVPFPGVDWGKLKLIWQPVPLGIFSFLLVGLCTSVMWGAIFNMAVEGLGKYTAIASGIFMTMVFGCAIMMAIQGYAADMFGYINSFWVIVFCAAYLLFYALIGSKPAKK